MKKSIDWPARYNNLWCLLIVCITTFGTGCALFRPEYRNIIPCLIAFLFALLLYIASKVSPRNGRWLGTLQIISAWLTYSIFKSIHLSHPRSFDTTLYKIDQWLWSGKVLPEYLQSLKSVGFSELMSFCYLSFSLLVIALAIYYICKGDDPDAIIFFHGLMMMYLFSFIIYLFIPSASANVIQPELIYSPSKSADISKIAMFVIHPINTSMTAFPSLSSGIGIYILGHFFFIHQYKIALLILPIVGGLLVSTLYLLQHYGISLIAGAVIAFIVLFYLYRLKDSFYI